MAGVLTGRTIRAGFVALVLLCPALWFLDNALFDPNVELLAPGRGTWIVDPRWCIGQGEPLFPPTRYRLILDVPAPVPSECSMAVTALREFSVAVNGHAVFDSEEMVRNWKRPVNIHLDSRLRSGRNEVLVEVRDDRGPTPLRVSGDLPGARRTLSTGAAAWEAAYSDLDWSLAVPAGQGEWYLQRKALSGRSRAWLLMLAAGVAALCLAGLLSRARKPESEDPSMGFLRRQGPSLLVLALLITANLSNGNRFPYRQSRLDWGGHTDHIRYSAKTWRPPLAHEGWQMYQPPLYYWLAGTVYRVSGGFADQERAFRWIQRMGGTVGALHVVLVFFLLKRFGPASPTARAWGLLAFGGAPVLLTVNCMITNEPTAGFVSGLALFVGALVLTRDRVGPFGGAAMGLCCGAALLSKFSGLMPTAAIALCLGIRLIEPGARARVRTRVLAIAAFCAVVAATAGPYYLRNFNTYGKLFVGNWDPVMGAFYETHPGYRTPAFYYRFGRVFTHTPERARWSSFWDGLYATTWGEIHDNYLKRGHWKDPAVFSRSLIIFALALLPTLACLAGFVRSITRAVSSRRAWGLHLVLVAATVFSVASVMVFTMVLPIMPNVKAIFLLQLSGPFAFFSAHGLARMERGLGRGRHLITLVITLMGLLIMSLFFYRFL